MFMAGNGSMSWLVLCWKVTSFSHPNIFHTRSWDMDAVKTCTLASL